VGKRLDRAERVSVDYTRRELMRAGRRLFRAAPPALAVSSFFDYLNRYGVLSSMPTGLPKATDREWAKEVAELWLMDDMRWGLDALQVGLRDPRGFGYAQRHHKRPTLHHGVTPLGGTSNGHAGAGPIGGHSSE